MGQPRKRHRDVEAEGLNHEALLHKYGRSSDQVDSFQKMFMSDVLLGGLVAQGCVVTASSNVAKLLIEQIAARAGTTHIAEEGPAGVSIGCSWFEATTHCCETKYVPEWYSQCTTDYVRDHSSLLE